MAKYRVVFGGIEITKIENDNESKFCTMKGLDYSNLSAEGMGAIEDAVQALENALHDIRKAPAA
jgi:hypothetical protein